MSRCSVLAACRSIHHAGWALSAAMMLLAGCENKPEGGPRPLSDATPSSAGAGASAAASALPQPAVAGDDVLAKVNGTIISKRDLELMIEDLKATAAAQKQPWQSLPAAEDPQKLDLVDLLGQLVDAELEVQDAMARGIHREPAVQHRFLYRGRNFYAQEWLLWQINRLNVTDADVEQFYKTNQGWFLEPEQIKVRQLAVRSEDEAKTALVKLLEGMDFQALAQQVSVHPEAAGGEQAGKWMMKSAEKAVYAPADDKVRQLTDPALEEAAFAVKLPGGFSSLVKGPDGNYHIFQLVERRGRRQKQLTEPDVAPGIRQFLERERLTKLVDELETKAKVEQFPDRLGRVTQ